MAATGGKLGMGALNVLEGSLLGLTTMAAD
jgi:hypothetical protein